MMLSVLAMTNGETPSASICFSTAPSGFIASLFSLSEAFPEKRKPSTIKPLTTWDITDASAAPATPIRKVNMNSGSSPMFSPAPTSVDTIAKPGRPCALMNIVRPAVTITKNVPVR